MKGFFIIALVILVLAVRSDPPTPYWGGNPVWSAKVRVISHNSSASESTNMTAQYYYNANINGERYDYDNNQNDEMCRISGFEKWEKVRCNVIYAKDGWSYVEFPDAPYCCKCTNAFGAVRYDWLQVGSKYIGRQTYNNITVDHWLKSGNPVLGPLPNNYYATVGDQIPVRFLENSTSIYKEVQYTSYSRTPLNSSLFDPPANCGTQCPGHCKDLHPNSEQNLKIQ